MIAGAGNTATSCFPPSLIGERKCGAGGSVVAEQGSHEAGAREDEDGGAQRVGHHGGVEGKHLTHVPLSPANKDEGGYTAHAHTWKANISLMCR